MNIDSYLYKLEGLNFSIDQKRTILHLIKDLIADLAPIHLKPGLEDKVEYVFVISEDPSDKKNNLNLAANILFEKVVSVKIQGIIDGVEYDTIGVYNNGYITAMQKDMQIVFNVDFNDGTITIESLYHLDKFTPCLELKIGNNEEDKQYNKEKLVSGHFFVHLDYGYGVGTYQPTEGGFAHVTTAYGDESFFTISIDGAIEADRDYIKPNEPYSLILKSEQIGVALDDITGSKVAKAGELIINGSTGAITYTRTADSTMTNIYFSDTKKDGSLTVLHYSTATKTINASVVA